MLGENECRSMTGLSMLYLTLLLIHLRIPGYLRDYRSQRLLHGQVSFLHYMTYNRLGLTMLQLSLYHFEGDPRRFTYAIRAVSKHIHNKFYHKISGQSLRQWIPYIHQFREAIWKNIDSGGTLETTTRNNDSTSSLVYIDISFETFRMFGFVDDTGFRTTASGIEARRRYGFHDDIQRPFYSRYLLGMASKYKRFHFPMV